MLGMILIAFSLFVVSEVSVQYIINLNMPAGCNPLSSLSLKLIKIQTQTLQIHVRRTVNCQTTTNNYAVIISDTI